MSRCPHCDQSHQSGTDYCPRTGRPLVDVATRMIGRTIAGKYRLLSCLGQGGMGTIFRAEHAVIGNYVAVKLLHEPFAASREPVQRLYREARATGAIGHPNIIHIFDVGETDEGIPFLVMELLEGESLGDHLEKNGPRPLGFVLDMGIQMLSALEAAHRAGIIHRDLKSDNVFLMPSAEMKGVKIKLLDFGVSKFVTPDRDGLNLTQTGSILGTPYYMSPEQASGKKDLDHRLDIYAAGIILYECLTGSVPHEASNYNALLMEIITHDVKPFRWQRPDVPKILESAIVKALSRDREQRWSKASGFMGVLEQVKDGLSEEELGGYVEIGSSDGLPQSGGSDSALGSLSEDTNGQKSGKRPPVHINQRNGRGLSESASFVVEHRKHLTWIGVVLVALVAAAAVAASLVPWNQEVLNRSDSRDLEDLNRTIPVLRDTAESPVRGENPSNKLVRLQIKCRPSGAEVYVDGMLVKGGKIEVKASREPLDLVAEAPGYETKRMGIIPLKHMDVEVSLTPLVLRRKTRSDLPDGKRPARGSSTTPSRKRERSGKNADNTPSKQPNSFSGGTLSVSDTDPPSLDRPMDNPF